VQTRFNASGESSHLQIGYVLVAIRIASNTKTSFFFALCIYSLSPYHWGLNPRHPRTSRQPASLAFINVYSPRSFHSLSGMDALAASTIQAHNFFPKIDKWNQRVNTDGRGKEKNGREIGRLDRQPDAMKMACWYAASGRASRLESDTWSRPRPERGALW
jgi:hypothetical protein